MLLNFLDINKILEKKDKKKRKISIFDKKLDNILILQLLVLMQIIFLIKYIIAKIELV